jgi:hypothetical protein
MLWKGGRPACAVVCVCDGDDRLDLVLLCKQLALVVRREGQDDSKDLVSFVKDIITLCRNLESR